MPKKVHGFREISCDGKGPAFKGTLGFAQLQFQLGDGPVACCAHLLFVSKYLSHQTCSPGLFNNKEIMINPLKCDLSSKLIARAFASSHIQTLRFSCLSHVSVTSPVRLKEHLNWLKEVKV